MIFNRKVEIIYSKKAQVILDSQSKICNWLYNHLLELVKQEYETNKKESTLLLGRNLRDQIPMIKKEKKYLYSVHSSPLKNVALRLKSAFDGFFYEKKGFPKFRSYKTSWFSLYYDEPNKGFKIIENKKLKLSLGSDKFNKRLSVIGTINEDLNLRESDIIKNFRLCKERNKYYGIFCIEREERKEKTSQTWISIDPNHKNFFVGVDDLGKSIEFEKISLLKYFDKKIDDIKSKRDKCKRYSNKWIRVNKALDHVYHKRQEQIKSLCYTIANNLAKHYDCVVIGDYTPSLDTSVEKSMHRSMLNQSIIGKFRNILEWVMIRSGKEYIEVDEHNTTKECSVCGHLEKKEPSIREFTCTNCQRQLVRDINSCINIAKKATKLSGSDYVNWELSQVTYTAKWDYRHSKILFTGDNN